MRETNEHIYYIPCFGFDGEGTARLVLLALVSCSSNSLGSTGSSSPTSVSSPSDSITAAKSVSLLLSSAPMAANRERWDSFFGESSPSGSPAFVCS
jgi:hypothetical protein